MSYLIDTNICIYLINQKPQAIIDKLKTLEANEIFISSISVAELEYGVANSANKAKNAQRLFEFLMPMEILAFAEESTRIYGNIRADLKRRGQIIGALDTLIAAQAIAYSLTLVTNNEKEFRRVKGLSVVNWLEPNQK